MSQLLQQGFESGSSLATLGAVSVIDCANTSGAGLRGSVYGVRGNGSTSQNYYCEFSLLITHTGRTFRIEADFDHADSGYSAFGHYAIELRTTDANPGVMISLYHGVGVSRDQLQVYSYNPTLLWTSASGVIVPNTTQRIKVCGTLSTLDGVGDVNADGTLSVYIDGVLLTTLTGLQIGVPQPSTGPVNLDKVTFGAMGRLDNIAIYDDGCTSVQVDQSVPCCATNTASGSGSALLADGTLPLEPWTAVCTGRGVAPAGVDPVNSEDWSVT